MHNNRCINVPSTITQCWLIPERTAAKRGVKNKTITHWRREVVPAFCGCKSKRSTKRCCSVLHGCKDKPTLPNWR
ncbi:hypothetical protein evm_014934 [Chilo suppressalis]|nr:hypothetical protein evm_014934 [Chilo suppressalis]